MNKLLKWIGAFILAVLMLGIPILFVLSLVFQWLAFVFLLLFTALDVILLTMVLYIFAEYLDNNF